MASKEVEINVKATGIGALKAELKDLKSQLADATDPAEMERLARAAGDVSDQITDINEKVKVFAAGNEFEKVGNGLGLIGGQLSSLDFKGAAESAKLLTTSIKGIDPKAFGEEVKGLISTVGSLSKAFVQMGIKLLANPLFLLIAVIGAIVGVIVMLKDKIVFLEKAFDLLMAPIKLIIDGLKKFADFLGLTSFAADEAAEKHIKANQKLADSYTKREAVVTDALDKEIRLAKINGQDVTDLEIEKQQKLAFYANKRLETNKDSLSELTAQMKRSTREQRKELKEQYDDLVKKIQDDKKARNEANFEITAINAQAAVDDKAAQEKAQQESEASHEKYLQKIRDAKQLHNQTLRQIKDIELSLMDEGLAKDLAVAEETYKRQLEDLEKSKNTYEDKLKLKAAFDAQYEASLKTADENNRLRVDTKNAEEKAKKDEKDANDLARIEAQNLLLQEITLSQEEWEKTQLINSYDEKFKLAVGNAELEKELKESLEKEKADISQKYRDEEATKEKEKLVTEQQLTQKKLQMASNALGILQDATSLFTSKNEKDARRQFQINKALSLSSAIVNTALAVTAALTAGGNPIKLATGMQFVEAGIAAASGAVSIAKIAGTQFQGSSGGGSGGGGNNTAPAPTSSQSSSAPLAPSFNLFGQGNNLNTTGGGQVANGNQNITVTAIVSETEMTSTQQTVYAIQNASKL
jgi:hypothetical protein